MVGLIKKAMATQRAYANRLVWVVRIASASMLCLSIVTTAWAEGAALVVPVTKHDITPRHDLRLTLPPEDGSQIIVFNVSVTAHRDWQIVELYPATGTGWAGTYYYCYTATYPWEAYDRGKLTGKLEPVNPQPPTGGGGGGPDNTFTITTDGDPIEPAFYILPPQPRVPVGDPVTLTSYELSQTPVESSWTIDGQDYPPSPVTSKQFSSSDSGVYQIGAEKDGLSDVEPVTVVKVVSIDPDALTNCLNSVKTFQLVTEPAGHHDLVAVSANGATIQDYDTATGIMTVKFDQVSTTATDYKTITATCGTSSVEAKATIIKVDLDVNNTSSYSDDYIPKKKEMGTLIHPSRSPEGYLDDTGQHYIPMTILLRGPDGLSAQISVEAGAILEFKDSSGNDLPEDGVTVTAGGAGVEVRVYGVVGSLSMWDTTIRARTNLTGDDVAGSERVTVLWLPDSRIDFRGSDQQGEALSDDNCRNFQEFFPDVWAAQEKVGKFIYRFVDPEDASKVYDYAFWQMEMKYRPLPGAEWWGTELDIRRRATVVDWGADVPGGEGDKEFLVDEVDSSASYAIDDPNDDDEHLTPAAPNWAIYDIDFPGRGELTRDFTDDHRVMKKAKFQSWVEVKIGSRWYTISKLQDWRMLMHLRFVCGQWEEDPAVVPHYPNEIVLGHDTLSGFSGTWNGWWNADYHGESDD